MHKFGPAQVPWVEQFFTASQVTVSWKKAYWNIRYKNKQGKPQIVLKNF